VARAYRSMTIQFGGSRNTLDVHQFFRKRDALDSPLITVHRERPLVTYRSVVGINQIGEVIARSEYLDAYAPIQFVKRQQGPAGHEDPVRVASPRSCSRMRHMASFWADSGGTSAGAAVREGFPSCDVRVPGARHPCKARAIPTSSSVSGAINSWTASATARVSYRIYR
jgi:hypothetical protein